MFKLLCEGILGCLAFLCFRRCERPLKPQKPQKLELVSPEPTTRSLKLRNSVWKQSLSLQALQEERAPTLILHIGSCSPSYEDASKRLENM